MKMCSASVCHADGQTAKRGEAASNGHIFASFQFDRAMKRDERSRRVHGTVTVVYICSMGLLI
jgi:hypothetical protein